MHASASRAEFWSSYFTRAYLQSVALSESQINQIGFEYTIYAIIISPFCTLKSVKDTFRMEYDQRMIIKFLLNEGADARDIADRLQTDCRQIMDRLQAQFGEHAYQFRMVQFWITEVWLDRQDSHNEIRIGRPLLDDLDAKILTILDKSLFKSTRSIAETLYIAHSTMLLHLHDFIHFRLFHLHWMRHLLRHDL
jgi:hypothetical protein